MADLVTLDLGRAPYGPTVDLQKRLHAEVREAEDERAYLLLVEHDPPVITLGRGADEANVTASRDRLEAEGVEVHPAGRGGDVTYHGPGQLVAYPILRLDLHGRDVRGYLRNLEDLLLRVLSRFGLEGSRAEGMTGVWLGNEKVAAIGVAIRRWVTWHGIALNVSTHLDHFNLIVPCGIRERGVTSLSRALGRGVTVEEVKPHLVECMVEVFGFDAARPGEVPSARP